MVSYFEGVVFEIDCDISGLFGIYVESNFAGCFFYLVLERCSVFDVVRQDGQVVCIIHISNVGGWMSTASLWLECEAKFRIIV